jgi:hypothetical protein
MEIAGAWRAALRRLILYSRFFMGDPLSHEKSSPSSGREKTKIVYIYLLILIGAALGGSFFVLRSSGIVILRSGTDIRENSLPSESASAMGREKTNANFNPAAFIWENNSDKALWSARDAHSLVTFKDKLWLMGGLNGNGFVHNEFVEYWNVPHFADIWVSEDGTAWKQVTDNAPWGTRRSAPTEVFKDKLWLIGGWQKGPGYKSDVWYSHDGKKWQEAVRSSPWSAREGHAVAVFRDALYMAGGVHFDQHKTKNDVWRSYDGIQWEELISEAPWTPRYDHTLTAFDGRLWLIGGLDFGDDIKSDTWVSEDGIKWKLVSDVSSWPARHGHISFPFRNYLWLLGGWGRSGGMSDVWYSADGIVWNKIAADTPWTGREDHAAAIFNNRLWMSGGMDKNWTWQKDLWKGEWGRTP